MFGMPMPDSRVDIRVGCIRALPPQGESVETIKKHEHLQSLQEQSSAEAISNQFMPEMEEEGDEGEDELILNFKSCMNLNDRKAASFKFAKKIQDLRWYEDEP